MAETPPWLDLMNQQRWSALGTIDEDGSPYVSSVAYAVFPEGEAGLLMHLSQLAAHTGYLQSRPACSLLIGQPDEGAIDPQTLARFTLRGRAIQIPRDSEIFAAGAKWYIDRFPHSEMRFGLGDFHLFLFIPEKGNFVGGFGAAGRIPGEKILAGLRKT